MRPELFSSHSKFRQYKPPKKRWRSFLDFIKNIFHQDKPRIIETRNVGSNPFKINRYAKSRRVFGVKTIIFIFVLLAWGGTMLYLPYFRVDKMVFYGLNIIKKDEVEAKIRQEFLNGWKITPKNNYFLISDGKIKKYLEDTYSLKSVTVKKNFPNELSIDLEEKNSSIIYDNGRKYFLLDNDGTAIKYLSDVLPEELTTTTPPKLSGAPVSTTLFMTDLAASSTVTTSEIIAAKKTEVLHRPSYRRIKKEFGDYPIIFDRRDKEVEKKQEDVLTKKFISSILGWQDLMDNMPSVGRIKYYIMEGPFYGVEAYTGGGWKIIFQPQDDLDIQFKNLKTILRDYKPTEYVDLRFADRIFWK